MDKREKMFAAGENPDDISFDEIPQDDTGVNTRTGFPVHKCVIKKDKNLLIKPSTLKL